MHPAAALKCNQPSPLKIVTYQWYSSRVEYNGMYDIISHETIYITIYRVSCMWMDEKLA